MNQIDMKKRFYNIIQLYSDTKQLSENHYIASIRGGKRTQFYSDMKLFDQFGLTERSEIKHLHFGRLGHVRRFGSSMVSVPPAKLMDFLGRIDGFTQTVRPTAISGFHIQFIVVSVSDLPVNTTKCMTFYLLPSSCGI